MAKGSKAPKKHKSASAMSKKKKIAIFGSIGASILIIIIGLFVFSFVYKLENVNMKSSKMLAAKFEGAVAPSYLPEGFEYEYNILNIKPLDADGKPTAEDVVGVPLFNIMFTKLNIDRVEYTITSLDENETVTVKMGGEITVGNGKETFRGVNYQISNRTLFGQSYATCTFNYKKLDYEIKYKLIDISYEQGSAEVKKIFESMIPEEKEKDKDAEAA